LAFSKSGIIVFQEIIYFPLDFLFCKSVYPCNSLKRDSILRLEKTGSCAAIILLKRL
jgi:hypothetical protein